MTLRDLTEYLEDCFWTHLFWPVLLLVLLTTGLLIAAALREIF